MSTRRAKSLPPPTAHDKITKQRSRCLHAICVSWKLLTCIFSHVLLVSLVVAYCIFGAITFEYLEAKNEIEVKKGISFIRGNLTEDIWKLTFKEVDVLHEQNWTNQVINKLQNFETDILNSMKTKGWDGNEELSKVQWTFSGALFYSIVVITTIGYGHISPKTYMGKVSTIFYAILGIPLMLLCLSNIGDIMASLFRFLYWRVCCFVCTREPKRANRLRRGMSEYYRPPSHRYSSKTNSNLRRSMRISQRTADSGIDTVYEPTSNMVHAYSATELHYNSQQHTYPETERYVEQQSRQYGGGGGVGGGRGHNPDNQHIRRMTHRESRRGFTVERDRNVNKSWNIRDQQPAPGQYNEQSKYNNYSTLPRNHQHNQQPHHHHHHQRDHRGQSEMNTLPKYRNHLEPRDMRAKSVGQYGSSSSKKQPDQRGSAFVDDLGDCGAPVLRNKYAIDEFDEVLPMENLRSKSVPRQRTSQDYQNYNNQNIYTMDRSSIENEIPLNRLHPPSEITKSTNDGNKKMSNHRSSSRQPSTAEINDDRSPRASRSHHRERHIPPPPSPRIMSPLGFAVHRQARMPPMYYYENDSQYGDGGDLDYPFDQPPRVRPVPIWLCVFLVVSYIIAGAFLFSSWEGWTFLDSAYFCFITLTTIGFGDFVPAQGVKENPEISIAFCSLYLLFGIALLAMSFNLVQEEVITNVKTVAMQLGILKDEENVND